MEEKAKEHREKDNEINSNPIFKFMDLSITLGAIVYGLLFIIGLISLLWSC